MIVVMTVFFQVKIKPISADQGETISIIAKMVNLVKIYLDSPLTNVHFLQWQKPIISVSKLRNILC
jgi:hypothetical protein